MKKFVLMAMAVAVAFFVCGAPVVRVLPWQMMARYGASHGVEFDWRDVARVGGGVTNQATVFTNTLPGGGVVEFVGMVVEPWGSTRVTNEFSMAVSHGMVGVVTNMADAVALTGTNVLGAVVGTGERWTVGKDGVDVVTTFTNPGANRRPDELNVGKVKVFWKVFSPR